MSHYTVIKISLHVNDLDFIKEACKELRLTFRVGGRVRYYSSGNQTNADYVISIPGSNYDVGLQKNAKGNFELIYDKYDGSIEKALGKDCCKLVQSTVYHKIVKAAKLNGKITTRKFKGESLYIEVTG